MTVTQQTKIYSSLCFKQLSTNQSLGNNKNNNKTTTTQNNNNNYKNQEGMASNHNQYERQSILDNGRKRSTPDWCTQYVDPDLNRTVVRSARMHTRPRNAARVPEKES